MSSSTGRPTTPQVPEYNWVRPRIGSTSGLKEELVSNIAWSLPISSPAPNTITLSEPPAFGWRQIRSPHPGLQSVVGRLPQTIRHHETPPPHQRLRIIPQRKPPPRSRLRPPGKPG